MAHSSSQCSFFWQNPKGKRSKPAKTAGYVKVHASNLLLSWRDWVHLDWVSDRWSSRLNFFPLYPIEKTIQKPHSQIQKIRNFTQTSNIHDREMLFTIIMNENLTFDIYSI